MSTSEFNERDLSARVGRRDEAVQAQIQRRPSTGSTNSATNNYTHDNGLTTEVLDDNQLRQQVMDSLNEMRLQRLFTDVTLSAGQEDFHCHKAILVASSPYFRAMFSSPFQEEVQGSLTISNISPWTIKRVLDYVYTGRVELSQASVEDLLAAANQLQFPSLRQCCAIFMLHQLDAHNCLGIQMLAHMYELTTLAETAKAYAKLNFHRVMEESREWVALSLEDVIEYVQSDDLEVKSEETVFNAAMRWLQYDFELRIKYAQQLLALVRLPHIPESFLRRQLKKNPVIKESPMSAKLLQEAIHIRRSAQLSSSEHARPRRVPSSATTTTAADPEGECLDSAEEEEEEAAQNLQLPRTVYTPEDYDEDSDFEEMESPEQPLQGEYPPHEEEETKCQTRCQVRLPLPFECPPPRPATLKRPMLVTMGGINSFILDSVEVFDPQKNLWSNNATVVPPLPLSCTWFSACVLQNDIYFTGGIREGLIESRVFRFCSERGHWQPCAPMPIPRARHSTVAVGGHLYVMGGVTTPEARHLATLQQRRQQTHNQGFGGGGAGIGGDTWTEDAAPETISLGVAQIHRYDPRLNQWFRAGVNTKPRMESSVVAVNESPSLKKCEQQSSADTESHSDEDDGVTHATSDGKSKTRSTSERQRRLRAERNARLATKTLLEIGGVPFEHVLISEDGDADGSVSGESQEGSFNVLSHTDSFGGRTRWWDASVRTQQQQIGIYRVQQRDRKVFTTSDYIQLPKPVHHVKCVTREMGSLVYILWETTGELAVLNLLRNSIVFLSPLPSASSLVQSAQLSAIATTPAPPPSRSGVEHCGMACVLDQIYVVGGYRLSQWDNVSTGSSCTDLVWRFDPKSNTWTCLENGLAQPRGLHLCVALNL